MAASSPTQFDLFGPAEADEPLDPTVWPEGLRYRADFLSIDEEASLLAVITELPFTEARYKQYTARRRTVGYGGRFDYDSNELRDGPPMPAFLQALRERVARWIGVPAEALQQALVWQYHPGTPLGWHRDVPDFEDVVGVSLAGPARMRFRRYPPVQPRKADVLNLALPPRSAYVMQGAARWDWQHSVAPTEALRYSITFRTMRVKR